MIGRGASAMEKDCQEKTARVSRGGKMRATTPPAPLTLQRDGDGWNIASLGGYPADPQSVEDVLGLLKGIALRAPIGTSEGSHAGLDVSDDTFTRRITLVSAAGEDTVYLGAASGSAMHIRRAGDTNVYLQRGESAWSISDQAKRYYNPIYLEEDVEQLDELRISNPFGNHEMVRAEDGWRRPSQESTQGVDQSEANALARSLLTVRMIAPVTTEVLPEHGFEQGTRVQWSVTEDDATRNGGYTIGAQADDTHHYLKSDASSWVVKVLSSSVARAHETQFSFLDGLDEG